VIPKYSELLLFIFGVHRNPELYPDPDKFDPQRFTLENQQQRNPFYYLPFSAGHRNCIGESGGTNLPQNTLIYRKLTVIKNLYNYCA